MNELKKNSLYEGKIKFEKDLLRVLKTYGFKISEVQRIKIDCKVDEFPCVSLDYGRNRYGLKKLKRWFRYLIYKLKCLFKKGKVR